MTLCFPALSPNAGFALADCCGVAGSEEAGLYVIHDHGRALYVGMALDLRRRLTRAASTGQHHQVPNIYKRHAESRVVLIEFRWWELPNAGRTECQFRGLIIDRLRELESAAIAHYMPRYNVA